MKGTIERLENTFMLRILARTISIIHYMCLMISILEKLHILVGESSLLSECLDLTTKDDRQETKE